MREYAKKIYHILASPVLCEARLVVESPATVQCYEKGPEHKCSLHLDFQEQHRHVVEAALTSYKITFVTYQT